MCRLYLNDDFEMYDGMIFKANHTLFEVAVLVIKNSNWNSRSLLMKAQDIELLFDMVMLI